MTVNSALNLSLPAAPLTTDPALAGELQIIYNALQILQQALNDAGIPSGGISPSPTVLAVPNGGTGVNTATGVLIGTGVTAITTVAGGVVGHQLRVKTIGPATYEFSASGTGDVVGPAGATNGNVAVFGDATGKLIADGGTLGSAAFQNVAAFDAAGAAAAAQSASQPVNAKLTSISALVSAAGWLHNDGAGAFSYTTPTYTNVGALAVGGTAVDSSKLEGGTWETPGTIGSTTPNTGAFTQITSSGATGNSHTRTTDGTVLDIANTYASFSGEASTIHVSRAANSGYNLVNYYANGVSQFNIDGTGAVTAAGAGKFPSILAGNGNHTLSSSYSGTTTNSYAVEHIRKVNNGAVATQDLFSITLGYANSSVMIEVVMAMEWQGQDTQPAAYRKSVITMGGALTENNITNVGGGSAGTINFTYVSAGVFKVNMTGMITVVGTGNGIAYIRVIGGGISNGAYVVPGSVVVADL